MFKIEPLKIFEVNFGIKYSFINCKTNEMTNVFLEN